MCFVSIVQAVVKGKGKYPTQLFPNVQNNNTLVSENGSKNATKPSFPSTVSNTKSSLTTSNSSAVSSKKNDSITQTSHSETPRGRVSKLSNTNGIESINNGFNEELIIDTNQHLDAKTDSLLSPKHLTPNKPTISPRHCSSGG